MHHREVSFYHLIYAKQRINLIHKHVERIEGNKRNCSLILCKRISSQRSFSGGTIRTMLSIVPSTLDKQIGRHNYGSYGQLYHSYIPISPIYFYSQHGFTGVISWFSCFRQLIVTQLRTKLRIVLYDLSSPSNEESGDLASTQAHDESFSLADHSANIRNLPFV